MTKQEQIDKMAKYICNVCEMGNGFTGNCSEGGTDSYKHCTLTQETAKALYEEGYRQEPLEDPVLAPDEQDDEISETDEILEVRYDLKAEIKHLNTIVERLDELLVKPLVYIVTTKRGEYVGQWTKGTPWEFGDNAFPAIRDLQTPEEIKKGLEKCTGVSCNGCPYNDNYTTCTDRLKTDARELIIKQEQEIERLTEERNKLSETLSKYIKASDKEIVAQVKQAVKEFADKIKEKLNNTPNGWAYTTYIDELIKEYGK